MNRPTALAIRIVRAWTRVYTFGLPPPQRTARQAEIDSDLWELAHDPASRQRGRTPTQILIRLFAGIPDDLAWRLEIGSTAHTVPARALAAAGMMAGPRRISALSLSATIHVICLSAAVWLTSHGYLYWQNPVAAAPEQADLWEQSAAYEIGAEPLSAPETDAAPRQPNQFIMALLQNRYALEVGHGYLLGTGAPVLQAAIRRSRFVLLGDDHDVAQIVDLGNSICQAALQPCGGVLMRIEALQVYRGLNPSGRRGTGSDFAVLAERQGLQSLHLRVVKFNGSPETYPKALRLFLSHRLHSQWTLFDLRPLRRNFNVLAGRANTDLATLVYGIDMLVVVP